MKIGMITDSLPGTSFKQMLAVAARLSMDTLEFGCAPGETAEGHYVDYSLDFHADTT